MAHDWAAALEAEVAKKGVSPRASEIVESDNLLASLVGGVNEYAIFMLDPHGVIKTWNGGARRIKQYEAAEVIGRHFRMLYLPEDRRAQRPEKNLTDALRHGHTEDIGWRRKKDGSHFWADALITPIYDDDGKLLGFAKVIRDLTLLNRAERHARDLEVSEREERFKRQLIALVSHELRTPLTTIRGYADLIADGGEPVSIAQGAYAAEILQATAALTRTVDAMLDLTTLQAGLLHLEPGPTDFAEVVQGVVLATQGQAQDKHLWLANHVSSEIPDIVTDAQRVSQVLVYILDNAIKFTPEGGRIEVSASIDGENLRCEVSDTGRGIAPDDLEALFKTFSPGDMTATRTEGGLGIGLSISRQLIEALGGHIGILSEVGRGSTFWFTLPRRGVGVAPRHAEAP